MNVIFSDQDIPERVGKSIFLVGPTPRKEGVKSWRPEALEILVNEGFDGIVFVPEWSTGQFKGNYEDQIAWEWNAMHSATAIAAWVPRSMPDMPAMTTNVEFGLWVKKRKFFYGRPDDAVKCRYLDEIYKYCAAMDPENDLRSLLKIAERYTRNYVPEEPVELAGNEERSD